MYMLAKVNGVVGGVGAFVASWFSSPDGLRSPGQQAAVCSGGAALLLHCCAGSCLCAQAGLQPSRRRPLHSRAPHSSSTEGSCSMQGWPSFTSRASVMVPMSAEGPRNCRGGRWMQRVRVGGVGRQRKPEACAGPNRYQPSTALHPAPGHPPNRPTQPHPARHAPG